MKPVAYLFPRQAAALGGAAGQSLVDDLEPLPRAALARRARENPADAELITAIRTRLRSDWPAYAIVEVTQSLVELAGEYADTFALRGYDSVQLAAARILQEASDETFHFAVFDTRLEKSARVLGMRTLASA